ncbi:uncharacterized protein LOC102678136 [Apis dorsata]|uniref:uncharacterized protein LOC102678136 n=1 Tax=Apis dorsata TaxID=7462 RepID=UPI00129390AA|nr:uncharacterized protein LOC102678136 [Apis dorsata]
MTGLTILMTNSTYAAKFRYKCIKNLIDITNSKIFNRDNDKYEHIISYYNWQGIFHHIAYHIAYYIMLLLFILINCIINIAIDILITSFIIITCCQLTILSYISSIFTKQIQDIFSIIIFFQLFVNCIIVCLNQHSIYHR